MRRPIRTWWFFFSAATGLAVIALLWMTVVVLASEQRELRTETELLHQESVRLALWRMDSWLAPRLAQEAARPYYEYRPFYAQDRAYTRVLSQIAPGEVLTPSPLLTYVSDIFTLHFEIDESGAVGSPQVPQGNYRDLAEASYVSNESVELNGLLLDEVTPFIQDKTVPNQIQCGEIRFAELAVAPEPVPVPPAQEPQQSLKTFQETKNRAEGSRRAQTSYGTQQWFADNKGGDPQTLRQMEAQANDAGFSVDVGPLVPVWLPAAREGDEPRLAFMRRASTGETPFLQGVLADWSTLRQMLEAEIADIFPGAQLIPVPVEDAMAGEDPDALATIPVRLVANWDPIAPRARITLVRMTLLIAWVSLAAVVLASGLSLRSAINLGEKRHHFASTVTHELRTPLTTFRMYSEMLADGMVPEEEQPTYFETLKTESSRLSTLVENVLAYARLEEGRAAEPPQRMLVTDLLERVVPPLEQRAESAGMTLKVGDHTSPNAPVRACPERVGQILFNLVDNACKYAADGDDRTLDLDVTRVEGRVELRVRDHGPGVPARIRRSIFAPFQRGGRGAGDTTAGVGLGLALARGLARDLGGELGIDAGAGDGACFVLTLPAA